MRDWESIVKKYTIKHGRGERCTKGAKSKDQIINLFHYSPHMLTVVDTHKLYNLVRSNVIKLTETEITNLLERILPDRGHWKDFLKGDMIPIIMHARQKNLLPLRIPTDNKFRVFKKQPWLCRGCGQNIKLSPYLVLYENVDCRFCNPEINELATKSTGEALLIELFTNRKVLAYNEWTFKDLRNPKTGRKLRYDIFLPNYNVIIEFHGIQHFEPTRFSSKISEKKAEKYLEEQIKKDNLKKKYAREKGYDFYVISSVLEIRRLMKTLRKKYKI